MRHKKVALIAFYDKTNRVLLQDRRSMPNRRAPFGFFGGTIEAGETPEQAVIRETKEELNYDLKEYAFVGHFDFMVDPEFRLEEWVYAAALPPLRELTVLEGAGMQLFSFTDATPNLLSDQDITTLRAIREFLEK